MALRVQLINEFMPPLNVDATDPIDINSLVQSIRRSGEFDGIIYTIVFDLEFLKEARQYIKQGYELYGGIDAKVVVNLYEWDPNLRKWKYKGNGQVNYNRYSLKEITATVNIEQTGNERRVMNLMEKDVDQETIVSENGSALPPQTMWNIPFHSKAILKQYDRQPSDVAFEDPLHVDYHFINVLPPLDPDIYVSSVVYCQIDNLKVNKDDLENSFETPFGSVFYDDLAHEMVGAGDETMYSDFLSESIRKTFRNPIYEATETGTAAVDIQLRMKHKIVAVEVGGGDLDICGSGILGNVEIFAWFERRDKTDTIISITEVGQWDLSGCGGDTREGVFETKNYTVSVPTVPGDKMYCYTTYRIYGTYEQPSSFPTGPDVDVIHTYFQDIDVDQTWVKINNTTVSAETTVSTPLIYEAIQRCVQYYTNTEDCFYSELLGRTDLGYAADGEGALIAVPNGHRLRLRNDKKIFWSLKALLDFVNAVYCIGFGFKIIDGVQKFVVEKKEKFYDKTTTVVSLGRVFQPEKNVLPKMYYNGVKYGYSTKIDIQTVNGVDEFNTLRLSSVPIVNTTNVLKIDTAVVAGGYPIEYQRRLYSSTKDGQYDDNNFAAVVIRDGLGFKTKKNEGYTSITGVFDAATGYNYDISPARCLQNWRKILASCVIRSFSKVCKFDSGTVNYTMVTQKTGEPLPLAENGAVDLTNVEPIFDPEQYKIGNVPCTRDMFTAIINNPYAVIEFQDRFGQTMEGFLNLDGGVEYNSDSKTLDGDLLKVFRP